MDRMDLQGAADGATRVLVVDDHPLARQGLRRLLDHAPRRFAVAEAGDGETALRQLRRLAPDLVILDLHLPTPRGTSALCREITSVSPTTRILICTAFEDDDLICECLAEGARGCVLKDAETSDIATALARVEAGETVIAPRIAGRLALRLTEELRDGDGGRLTRRERSVLALLGDGLSNRQIADRLFLSEHTIKGYVTSLLRKLGARSRLEAVALATRAGLLRPSDGRRSPRGS
ncbi:MAG: response regulator transcription factor [Actinobacteria bacterium]|nr:response regulator transcription factor [Actinomycetota bacterium]